MKAQQAWSPELVPSRNQLEELVLWGARAKDADGLDHGYWQPFGPACDLAAQDCFPSFSTWVVKQLRSHRDAAARLAASLQQLQRSLWDDEGKADFGSAMAMMTQLPSRLEAVEESTQTLLHRVNHLSGELLKPRRELTGSKSEPLEIRDKPPDQAVKECREAVSVMLEMQRNMKLEQQKFEEQLSLRLAGFDEAFRAQGLASQASLEEYCQSRDRELEGLYARAAAAEEGIQKIQETFIGLAEFKARSSTKMAELNKRCSEVESQMAQASAGIEGLTQELLSTKLDAGESTKVVRIASKISEPSRLDNEVQQFAQELQSAQSAAQRAIAMVEELKAEVSRLHETRQVLQVQRAITPPSPWPCRSARRLPYMPPSSLAQPPEVGASERSPSQAKEHFIPPTGGGFRTKPPRRKRPSTADCTGSKPRDSLRCDFAPCQALAA